MHAYIYKCICRGVGCHCEENFWKNKQLIFCEDNIYFTFSLKEIKSIGLKLRELDAHQYVCEVKK